MGRVNYGPRMMHQRKGIADGVLVNGALRSNWEIYTLPLDNIGKIDYNQNYFSSQPAFGSMVLILDVFGKRATVQTLYSSPSIGKREE